MDVTGKLGKGRKLKLRKPLDKDKESNVNEKVLKQDDSKNTAISKPSKKKQDNPNDSETPPEKDRKSKKRRIIDQGLEAVNPDVSNRKTPKIDKKPKESQVSGLDNESSAADLSGVKKKRSAEAKQRRRQNAKLKLKAKKKAASK